LYRYVRYLKRNGLDPRHYEVAFWSRISAIVVIPVMCVLALCFCFSQLRRAGAGARTVVGIGLGLAYYLVAQGFSEGGEVFGINPALAAFAPCIALAGVTAIALVRLR
jgi:lipopolysaccharide export system permease protein